MDANDDELAENHGAKRVKFDEDHKTLDNKCDQSSENILNNSSLNHPNNVTTQNLDNFKVDNGIHNIQLDNNIRELYDNINSDEKDIRVQLREGDVMPTSSEPVVLKWENNHLPDATYSENMDSDVNRRNPGPSAIRVSYLTRNYRRRILNDSSDDDEEFRVNRNSTHEQSDSQTQMATQSQSALDVVDPFEENDTESDSDNSLESAASHSTTTSGSELTVEINSDSSESTDRFNFESNEEVDNIVESILQKQKSKYAWYSVPSIMYRQNGFSTGKSHRHMTDTPYNFQAGVRGSLHCIERLELMSKLSEHFGCINCLNFSQNGRYLASGSDDLRIKIWDWARKKSKVTIQTNHTSNIFQAKFIDYNGYDDCMELVSSDQSGSVRHYTIAPCGSVRSERVLCMSSRAVHKLGLPSNRPYEILSAGEDARVMLMDLRENTATKLINAKCSLYSIACHPLDSNKFCVSGRDQFVRVYDRRNLKSILRTHCPEHLRHGQFQTRSVTSAVYNYLGTEILASYSNENIYLFDSSNNQRGEFLHKYCGHRNNRTIKGVNFYGPRSEFVISGSENPGHVFFWEKATEAIVQMIVADIGGVVNCLEPHPCIPILATSGLADEIRLWHPSKDKDPVLTDLKKFVHRNVNVQQDRHSDRNAGIDIFQFILQRMRRRAEEDFEVNGDRLGDQDEASQSVPNDSSNEGASVDDDANFQLHPCNTS